MSDKKVWLCECEDGDCIENHDVLGSCSDKNNGVLTPGYFVPATRRRLEKRVLRAADEYQKKTTPSFCSWMKVFDAVNALRAYDEKEKAK